MDYVIYRSAAKGDVVIAELPAVTSIESLKEMARKKIDKDLPQVVGPVGCSISVEYRDLDDGECGAEFLGDVSGDSEHEPDRPEVIHYIVQAVPA